MKRSDKVAALILAPLVGVAIARVVAHDVWFPLIWLNSVTAWLYIPAWPLLTWALVRRRHAVAVAAAALVLAHIAWVGPGMIAEGREVPEGERLRVASSNVLFTHVRPSALARELVDTRADVLVLVEVSPRWASELDSELVTERYPHRHVAARRDARGLAVLSTRPLAAVEERAFAGVPYLDVRLTGPAVRLLAVHVSPPLGTRRTEIGRRQLRGISELARSVSTPLVVAGDFNSTNHSAGLRALERVGLRDVHAALGRGLVATWPNGTSFAPPLHIDHVLVSSSITPIRIREGRGVGSDHRPVIADLVIPRGSP